MDTFSAITYGATRLHPDFFHTGPLIFCSVRKSGVMIFFNPELNYSKYFTDNKPKNPTDHL